MSKSNSSTGWKWIAGTVLAIIFMVILSIFLLGIIVKEELKEQVVDQTDGAYRLEVEDLDLNIFRGDASAYQVKVIPDTTQIKKGEKFRDIYEISARILSIKGLDIWKLVFHKNIEIGELNFIEPKVELTRILPVGAGTGKSTDSTEFEDDNLLSVIIGQINLNDAQLEIVRGEDQEAEFLTIEKISLSIDEFQFLHAVTGQRRNKVRFDNLTFAIKNYTLNLPDSLYSLRFDSLNGSVEMASFKVHGLSLTPRLGKYEFGKFKGEQTDRLQLYNKLVHVSDFDFKALLQYERIDVGAILLDSVNLHVFRDKNIPMPERHKKLPQQQIRELGMYVKIDSIELKNATITYEEKIPAAEESGNIKFVNLNSKLYTITNDSSLLEQGAAIKGHAYSYLMGAGKIDAWFNLPIADGSNAHYIEGSLSPMDLDLLNPMIKHVAFIQINSGHVGDLHFQAQVNENTSEGSMKFAYEDLKISVLNKDGMKGNNDMASFVANVFIIKKANPLRNQDLRIGDMHYQRDKRKSILNFWWKTLLSGFKDTLGLPDKGGA